MSQLQAIVVAERLSASEILYVAVLLNHYLAAQGDSPAEAVSNLGLAIKQTIAANQHAGLEAFHGLKAAPAHYQSLAQLNPSIAVQISGDIGGYSFELNSSQAA